MVLIGLLLVALVCLALGLVLASAGWLIGSLAASAAAAWVLWRGRDRAGAAAEKKHAEAQKQAAADATDQVPEGTRTEEVPAMMSSAEQPEPNASAAGDALAAPDYARRRADELSGLAQPQRAGAVAVKAAPADPEVWVIDGRPNYHTAHCGVLLGADGEVIPRSQAVEDGFTPCTLCDPDAHFEPPAPGAPGPSGSDDATDAATEAVAPVERTVWVVDGWPHYHDDGCTRLSGEQAEVVPFEQAVEDGFTPCPTCRPVAPESAGGESAGGESGHPETGHPETGHPEGAADASEPAAEESAPGEAAADESGADKTDMSGEVELSGEAESLGATDGPTAAEATPDESEPDEATLDEIEPATETVDDADLVAADPVAADSVAADSAAADSVAAADTTQVWVVAGRPRFHREDCIIVEGQGAVALTHDLAIEEGFKPCSLCEPDSARA